MPRLRHGLLHYQLPVLHGNVDGGAVGHLAGDEGAGEAGLQFALQISFHRPRTVDGVEGGAGDEGAGVGGEDQLDVAVLEATPQVLDLEVDDPLDLLQRAGA